MTEQSAVRVPYAGPLRLGMVFDFEPGRKHRYERLIITRMEGTHIWCYGRSGETFHEEPEFRRSVVYVADQPERKLAPKPAPLEKRYEGPIEVDMVFDFEPGKKHMYERLTITQIKGSHIWARGRSGGTFYEESEFRDHVVPVAVTT